MPANKIIYTVSKAVITLPENSVTLDLSKSIYNGHGKLTYSHTKLSGPEYTILNPTKATITPTGLPVGKYSVQGKVFNNKLLFKSAIVNFEVVMPAAPTANAGPPQTIPLPGTLHLKGTATGTGIKTLWSGQGVITNPSALETDVNELVAGVLNYSLTSMDQYNRSVVSTMQATILPVPQPIVKCKHGALIAVGSAQEKIAILMAVNAVASRFSAILTDFNGKLNMFEHATDAGLDVLLSLNWKRVEKVGDTRIPNKFLRPADYPAYRDAIKRVLDVYRPKITSIENEPTTKIFYSDDIQYYIDQLVVAVEVVRSYGLPVADGGIHEAYINSIMGGGNVTGNAAEVKKMIEAYKTIPLDYINVHTNGSGNSLPAGGLKKVADYLRAQTGKKVMSNEYHLSNNSGELMKSFIKEWNAGGYEYAIIYSGGKGSEEGGNAPLNVGTTTELTEVGIEFRNRDS